MCVYMSVCVHTRVCSERFWTGIESEAFQRRKKDLLRHEITFTVGTSEAAHWSCEYHVSFLFLPHMQYFILFEFASNAV